MCECFVETLYFRFSFIYVVSQSSDTVMLLGSVIISHIKCLNIICSFVAVPKKDTKCSNNSYDLINMSFLNIAPIVVYFGDVHHLDFRIVTSSSVVCYNL